MTKVLDKTFDILELLASNPERELSVSEAAMASGLNKATAGRLLADLLARGYAYQGSPRGGYSLGPMAYGLAARGVFRKDLVDAAKESVRRLAHEELQESAILACLHRGRRYILVNENGNREVQPVIDKPWYEDLYLTATGRLLLAYASDSELAAYVARHGLPGELWDGLHDEESLRRKLAETREQGALSCRSSTPCFWVMAFPVRKGGRVEAALGLTVLADGLSASRAELLLVKGLACAKEIESKLEEKTEDRRG